MDDRPIKTSQAAQRCRSCWRMTGVCHRARHAWPHSVGRRKTLRPPASREDFAIRVARSSCRWLAAKRRETGDSSGGISWVPSAGKPTGCRSSHCLDGDMPCLPNNWGTSSGYPFTGFQLCQSSWLHRPERISGPIPLADSPRYGRRENSRSVEFIGLADYGPGRIRSISIRSMTCYEE